jgi:beta-lactamase regulating signal transducer with metallopeptidase domain
MIPSFSHPVLQTLAWVLVHFLWQGALLGLLARGGLWLLRTRSPQLRYLVACGFLLAMALSPLATFSALRPESLAQGISVESAPARTVTTELVPALASVADRISLRETLRPALPWALAAWMAGVALLSLRLLGGWFWLLRLRGRLAEPAGACWQMGVDALARRMKLKERVRMLRSWAVDAPMVVGWLKPVILVPAAAFTGLSPEALEAILAHELAHVRRHDYLVNLVQSAVEVLLFYHPAVWWVSSQIRQERELCCDDAAVALCGDPILYARALTSLEQLRRPLEPEPHLALAAHGGNLMHRIKRLITPTLPPTPTRRAGLFAALAVTALGAGTALHFNEDPPKAPVAPASPAPPTGAETRTIVVDAKAGEKRQVRIKGEVKVQPDPQHDFVLGEGGSLEISQKAEGQTRRFKAWREGGTEKRSYTLNGEERPLDAEWLKRELTDLKGARSHPKEDPGGKEKRIEIHVRKQGKDEGDIEERIIHLDGPPNAHERRMIRIEADGKGPDGKTKIFFFRDGEEKLEIDAEKLARHAREMAEKHKEMARHLEDLRELHGLKGLGELQVPDFDFDFDFDDQLAPGKKVIIQRHGAETLPGPRVWVEDGKRDPRREVDQLRAEIDRLNRRLERLQERLGDGHAPEAPRPHKPPRPPKPAPAPPPPPSPPTPRAAPAPPAPRTEPTPPAPAPAPAPTPKL